MDTPHIKKTIEDFLEKLGVHCDAIDVVPHTLDPDKTIFMIRSDDSGVLIGNQGENLNAVNHLVRQMVRRTGAHDDDSAPDFVIDVNSYREEQMADIIYRAKVVADRARLFKRDVELPPASPYERMVVHSYLSKDPLLMTESRGEGKFRRVVVKYQEREVSSE